MPPPISLLSSMATHAVLTELAAQHQHAAGEAVQVESVGGVDAARRVAAGEAIDVVVLASDALAKLAAAGRVLAASVRPLARSGVAVAVRQGADWPDLRTEAALRAAVLAAPSIGHSTGPSGVALLQLFARWGIGDELKGRIVQAPPGVAVAALVARGEVALGFQQLSEMLHADGITVAGPLPDAVQINTTFSAALGAAGSPSARARGQALIDFMASDAAAPAKQRHGMAPA